MLPLKFKKKKLENQEKKIILEFKEKLVRRTV